MSKFQEGVTFYDQPQEQSDSAKNLKAPPRGAQPLRSPVTPPTRACYPEISVLCLGVIPALSGGCRGNTRKSPGGRGVIPADPGVHPGNPGVPGVPGGFQGGPRGRTWRSRRAAARWCPIIRWRTRGFPGVSVSDSRKRISPALPQKIASPLLVQNKIPKRYLHLGVAIWFRSVPLFGVWPLFIQKQTKKQVYARIRSVASIRLWPLLLGG